MNEQCIKVGFDLMAHVELKRSSLTKQKLQ